MGYKAKTYCALLFSIVFVPGLIGQQVKSPLRIVGIYDTSEDFTKAAFNVTIVRSAEGAATLIPTARFISTSSNDDAIIRKVCLTITGGVAAITGPQTYAQSRQVESVSSAYKLPYLQINPNNDQNNYVSETTLNFFPSSATIGAAIRKLLDQWNWQKFTIIHDNDYGDLLLTYLVNSDGSGSYKYQPTVRDISKQTSVRDFVLNLKRSEETLDERRFVLNCNSDRATEFLKQAKQYGMLSPDYAYILTSLDTQTLPLEDINLDGAQVFGFSIVDLDVTNLDSYNLAAQITQLTGKDVDRFRLKTSHAITHDAVKSYLKAVADFSKNGGSVASKTLSCYSNETWATGIEIIKHMKKMAFTQGITGTIVFDQSGKRSLVNMTLLQASYNTLIKIGSWQMSRINPGSNQLLVNLPNPPDATHYRFNKVLVVSTLLNEPHVILKQSYQVLSGNDRYTGFTIELLEALSQIVGFNYTIRMVGDGRYGNQDQSGRWNGMVGEVVRGVADFAMGDMTITYQREQVVDFTFPMLHVGLGVLLKKDDEIYGFNTNVLGFLIPFTAETWAYVAASYLLVSFSLAFLLRLTQGSYQLSPSKEENSASFFESFWFTLSSLMWQSSNSKVRGISTRLLAAVWWFVTLILICIYIANTTAWLLAHPVLVSDIDDIRSMEDLAASNKFRVGCVYGGSTCGYFKISENPEFQKMWMKITAHETMVQNNRDGVNRVLEGHNFAFIMETLTGEYTAKRHCNLVFAGGHNTNKGYGIAVRKGSPLREILSNAILQLQENTKIYNLKQKWWNSSPGQCPKPSDTETEFAPPSLEVHGLFLIVCLAVFICFLIGIAEFLWRVRRQSMLDGKSFGSVLSSEAMAIVCCRTSEVPLYLSRIDQQQQGNSNPEIEMGYS